jgi:hypothetical protein
MKKLIFFFFLFTGFNQLTEAQVKIGDNIAAGVNSSSILELESTNKGLLIPRLTSAQITAISNPANGLLVFNSDLNMLQVNTGTDTSPQWSFLVVAQGTGYKGAMAVPVGADTDRPSTPTVGMIRYNTSKSKFEGYNGTAWFDL